MSIMQNQELNEILIAVSVFNWIDSTYKEYNYIRIALDDMSTICFGLITDQTFNTSL